MNKPSLSLENRLWQEGYRVIGADEAGRGTWAGSLWVGMVMLRRGDIGPVQEMIEGHGLYQLRDSKLMSPKQRAAIYREILETGIPYSVGDATVEEIDRYGIEAAFSMALNRAGQALMEHERQRLVSPADIYAKTTLLIDGARYRSLRIADMSLSEATEFEIVAEDKLDQTCATVALASVVAKTHQETTMLGLNRIFPEYGFDKHNGYPTKMHKDAVAIYGTSIVHRTSWNVAL